MLIVSQGLRRSRRRVGSRRAAWPRATASDDAPELHALDTLGRGARLCRESAVRALTEEAPARMVDLAGPRRPLRRRARARGRSRPPPRPQRRRRARRGRAISEVLARAVLAHPRIDVSEREQGSRGGDVGGRTMRGPRHGRAHDRRPGGAARDRGLSALWVSTTNPPGSVGEGISMGYRAGASVADLEFVQFHPTALVGSTAAPDRGAARRRRAPARRAGRPVRRGTGAARRRGARDRRAGDGDARSSSGRPVALSGADGPAVRCGLPSRGGAGARRSRCALHDGRDRDRPAGRDRRPRALRGRRVRMHRCPRRQPAGVELDARVPRLRPPRSSGRPRGAGLPAK